MALVLADRVEQVTRTTGVADLMLAETIRGRQSFASVVSNGDTVIYVLEDAEGMEWEIGEGTIVLDAETTLERTTIRASSNAGAKISLSAGTHRVFLAADAQYLTDIISQQEVDQAIADHVAEPDPHPQYTTAAEAAAAAPVQTVNGQTGTVSLDAAAVGATPDSHVGSGGAQHAEATTSVAGFMSAADKTKLDGVEAGATADQSAAEVPYDNSTSGLTATDVQAAVDEVDANLDGHLASGTAHAAGSITSTSGNSVQQELDQRIGRINVALAGVDVTLTAAQVSAQIVNLTGTLTANVNVIVPDAARLYTFVNSTTGAFTVTVKTAAGTGVLVDQGQLRKVRSDGTDVVTGEGQADFPVMPTVAGDPIVESDSNANGEWTRWASGTQICTHTINGGSSIALGGGTYDNPYSTASFSWTYPQSFVDFGLTHGSPYGTLNNNEASILNIGNSVGSTTATDSMRIVKIASGAGAGSRSVALSSHGYWK